MASDAPKPRIGVRELALWALPLLASLGVLALTFAMNWEPWFGYAALIAGALGSLMIAGERLGAKAGRGAD